jgi:acetolactate synthase I/II/III large subunit
MAGDALDRRSMLKGLSLMGAATLASAGEAQAQAPAGGATQAVARDWTPATGAPDAGPQVQANSGSDFMLDVFKSVGFEYMAANPGTSWRGFHESLINYGGNKAPEFVTCTHEEASVAMAHGYAKIAGKPMLTCAHGTVGLMHASMALYNAWCDRVPIVLCIGNTMNGPKREPPVNWGHSAQDPVAMVRDFTKWDDNPGGLQHFAESAVRAVKIAMTPPMAPVVLVMDSELQENPIPQGMRLTIPKLAPTIIPQGEMNALEEAAKLLVAAENPVIVAGRSARTQAGIDRLVELAEALQCPVVDQGSRMNFPSRHKLNLTDMNRTLVGRADVVLALEVMDLYGSTHAFHDRIEAYDTPIMKPGAKLISISSYDLYTKSNYQDFQRYMPVDMAIAGDAEASMPFLIDAVKRNTDDGRKSALQARGQKIADQHDRLHKAMLIQAADGWNASPISTARMCAEVYNQLQHEDWSLASTTGSFVSAWPQRLWDMQKLYQNTGDSGGWGIGYCAPASVGAALANRDQGRITVSIQPDGDLMYSPGVLWTAAHHRIPILFVMHNNRAYHQEIMGIQEMANRHQRGVDRAHIGVTLWDPYIDFATVAKGFGVYSEGPITNASDLGPALQRAVAQVKAGGPALVDVVTQPR